MISVKQARIFEPQGWILQMLLIFYFSCELDIKKAQPVDNEWTVSNHLVLVEFILLVVSKTWFIIYKLCKCYIISSDFDFLLRAPIDEGSKKVVVISNDVTTVDGLAVDWLYNHIYWTNTDTDTIEVSSGILRTLQSYCSS